MITYTLRKRNLEFAIALQNTFRLEEQRHWLVKHRLSFIGAMLCVSVFMIFQIGVYWTSYSNTKLDSIVITVDFGEFSSLQKIRRSVPVQEIDEVFGNQYVKDKKIIQQKNTEDPRIGAAVNQIASGATAPVDLTLGLQPSYTESARVAGIEGMLMLEIILSEKGKVLRAKPMGKLLGHGLEAEAVRVFKKKRFRPSLDASGTPIVVKFYQPVRYVLE